MSDEQYILEQASEAFSNQDFIRALDLIAPLVEAGIGAAIGLLGLAYQHGAGVEKDLDEAVRLMQKAVELGDALAAHNLGRLYMVGTEGMEPDPQLSETYYQLAQSMGVRYQEDDSKG